MISLRNSGLLAAAMLMTLPALGAELETEEQKLGYMIGMDLGRSLKDMGADVDLDALFEAIRTVYADGTPAMTPEEANAIKQTFIQQRQAVAKAQQDALAAENLAASETFLAENATAEGVTTTASGLQYKVLTRGDGPTPSATDKVTVHYRGTLLDGTEFDSSYGRGEPISFELNRVIPGWTEGVQLMPVGSKYEFYIKPELGYGAAGGGRIPPNSTLIFEVELLGIEGTE